MLLFGGPRKPDSHPLANYRYAGKRSRRPPCSKGVVPGSCGAWGWLLASSRPRDIVLV